MSNTRKRRPSSRELKTPAPGGRTVSGGRAAKAAASAPRRDDAIENRRQARRLAAQRHQKQRWLKLLGLAVAIAVGLAAVIYVGNGVIQDRRANRAIAGVQSFDEQAGHTADPVTYAQTPPAGGQHSPTLQNCGYYAQPVHNENAVHSLEHGAVWITYRPDLPAEQVALLRQQAERQTYVLVSPYPDLSAPVVASAWGKQLQLTSADDARLAAFIRKYRQGPQTQEPGAACTGGTSATQ